MKNKFDLFLKTYELQKNVTDINHTKLMIGSVEDITIITKV